jgi:hypothetical protein
MASVDGAGQLEVVGGGRPDFSAFGRPHFHHRTIRIGGQAKSAAPASVNRTYAALVPIAQSRPAPYSSAPASLHDWRIDALDVDAASPCGRHRPSSRWRPAAAGIPAA